MFKTIKSGSPDDFQYMHPTMLRWDYHEDLQPFMSVSTVIKYVP